MKQILLQFDTDSHPSSFDRVVAIDAGVDELFSYGGISAKNVTGLVHGAIFTRGPADLKNTAIFVGGSNVAAGEELQTAVTGSFFGPMQVSVMMDSNGCNTTAAAAIACVRKHVELSGTASVVLGATGPVGQRAAELLALEGAHVTVVSRTQEKAEKAAASIRTNINDSQITAAAGSGGDELLRICQGHRVIIAAGAAGVCFLPEGALAQLSDAKVAVDLNAVPPLGIADIGATDKAQETNGVICYGALGVGGLKMKVHKRAIARLFESNNLVLATREIYDIALQISAE